MIRQGKFFVSVFPDGVIISKDDRLWYFNFNDLEACEEIDEHLGEII